jgi:hypothetical protein
VNEMEVEEANPTFNTNAPQDPDRLPALGIADAQYITAMIEKLADIIPRITVNLWDELTQRDQFRELNAQLEQLEEDDKQSKSNDDVKRALEKAGALQRTQQEVIREEIIRYDKLKNKQARKKSLAGGKTQSSRPSNGQDSPSRSSRPGGRGSQQSNQQSTSASGNGTKKGSSRKRSKKKKKQHQQQQTQQDQQQQPNDQGTHNPRSPRQGGRGRGGRGSQDNRGGANNAGRGRGGRRS